MRPSSLGGLRGRWSRPLLAASAAIAAVALVAAPAGAVTGWSHPLGVFMTRFGPAHDTAVDSGGYTLIASEGGAYSGIWLTSNQPDGGPPSWFNLQLTTQEDHAPSIAVRNDRFSVAFERLNTSTFKSRGIWTATNATGTIVVTKRDGDEDYDPSIALRNGKTYIAYQDATKHSLVYLTNATGSWVHHTVDTSCCSGPVSLELTSGGQPRIAYADGSNTAPTGVKYASSSSGSSWSISTVDTHPSFSVSLGLDSANHPHVAYIRTSHGVEYAVTAPSGWLRTLLSSAQSEPVDLAVDGAGHAFVAYGNNGAIFYDTNVGGTWHITQLTFPSADRQDFDPDIARFGTKAQVVFNRIFGGTTNDGIAFMKQT